MSKRRKDPPPEQQALGKPTEPASPVARRELRLPDGRRLLLYGRRR